jgi:small-conductance mechanosensitive channel
MKEDLLSLLKTKIFVIGSHQVTIERFMIAILVLVVGILFIRISFRLIGSRLLSKTPLKRSTSSALQKIFTYFAYLMILLFALRLVNIPLTAFAFLGGAIVIGIGFGAQNIINNFISGFIIMGEQPISIGNLVEIDGVLGEVEDIGARCTRIRTGENIHILVPNSSFLERNITNWTLSDNKIRTKVVAGVVYGSPVRQVEELLIKSARENDKVLKNPEPFVVFNDFGDNSLIFEVYFWITIKRLIERRLIESSVRFKIDELFREAGIVIAFPQRDVHLDTTQPLQLDLINRKQVTEKE